MLRGCVLLLFATLFLGSAGCAGLKKWLNTEPEFTKKSATSKTDLERRTGIGAELNDVEYAEYERIRKQNELDRQSRSIW